MPIATRRIRIIRFLMMLSLSIAMLAYGWFRSPSPRWVVGSTNEFHATLGFHDLHTILGFSQTGEMLTIRNIPIEVVNHPLAGLPSRPGKYRSEFVIRDPSSGRELRRYPCPENSYRTMTLLPDGQHLLLQSKWEDEVPGFTVFNISDGSTTPRQNDNIFSNFGEFSSNGKYCCASNHEGDTFIYDFEESKALYPVRKAMFSQDSKRWMMEDSKGDNVKLRFYSLETGQEQGSVVLPYTWQTILTYKSWVGDRIEFWMQDADSTRSSLYSCKVQNFVLSDLRKEPDWHGAYDRTAESKFEYQKSDHWAGVWRSVRQDSLLIDLWNSVNDFLRLNKRMPQSQIPVQTWQQLEPYTGRPISRPLRVESSPPNLSPDGRFLLTTPQKIQCWDLPLRSYLLMAIMLVIGQWIALWRSQWLLRRQELS